MALVLMHSLKVLDWHLRCSNNNAPTDGIKVEFTDEVLRLCDLAEVWKPSVAFSFYQMAGQSGNISACTYSQFMPTQISIMKGLVSF